MRRSFLGGAGAQRLKRAPAEHHWRNVWKAMACVLVTASILTACGKSDLADVKRPTRPIFICVLGFAADRSCQHRFNASQLISLRLDGANALAERHGYSVRRVAPLPLPRHEKLIADEEFNRIDVECAEAAEDCLVKRIVSQG